MYKEVNTSYINSAYSVACTPKTFLRFLNFRKFLSKSRPIRSACRQLSKSSCLTLQCIDRNWNFRNVNFLKVYFRKNASDPMKETFGKFLVVKLWVQRCARRLPSREALHHLIAIGTRTINASSSASVPEQNDKNIPNCDIHWRDTRTFAQIKHVEEDARFKYECSRSVQLAQFIMPLYYSRCSNLQWYRRHGVFHWGAEWCRYRLTVV